VSCRGFVVLDHNRNPQFFNVRQPVAQLVGVVIDVIKSSVVVCVFAKLPFGFEIRQHATQGVQRQRSGINHSSFSDFVKSSPLSKAQRVDSRQSVQGLNGLLCMGLQ
jgi:hypothetical protein